MPTLLAIMIACVGGGVLSVAAAALTLGLRATWINKFVAFAVGALLGAVFLEVLPHALESGKPAEEILTVVLIGVVLFFVLEKVVIWRHSHDHGHGEEALEEHDHGRSGWMILIGDTFHNFCDGVVIAAAFLADFNLGVVTAVAIVAHEVPQEVGDFLVLLHSGFSKRQALLFNMGSSLGSVIGGLVGYWALASVQHWVPYALALAAASMIYVAVADLIPGLQRRAKLAETVLQLVLLGLGIGAIALVQHLLKH
ncbi:MAG: ZIP family metal transporter [Betaproteobacteria bacterium]|nr:ZIP family metal transporter [Betaproteobacteria bacterium]